MLLYLDTVPAVCNVEMNFSSIYAAIVVLFFDLCGLGGRFVDI